MDKEESVKPEEVDEMCRSVDMMTDKLLDMAADESITKTDFLGVRGLVHLTNGRCVRATPVLREGVIEVLERVEYLLRVLLLKMRDVVPSDTRAPVAATVKAGKRVVKIEEIRKALSQKEPSPELLKVKSLRPVLRMKTLTFNNLGVLHSKNGNHERALDYLLRTLEVEIAGGLS